MHVLVTGGNGHIGSYVIPELIAAGHEVTGLARSDESAAAVSALGAKVRRGDISDLDGLKAAAESDGVIHVAHRQDLLPSGGIDANTLFGPVLARGGRLDAFIAADDPEAKARVSTFLESLGLRPFDVGGLHMAATLESLGLMLIGLARNGAGTFDIALHVDIG